MSSRQVFTGAQRNSLRAFRMSDFLVILGAVGVCVGTILFNVLTDFDYSHDEVKAKTRKPSTKGKRQSDKTRGIDQSVKAKTRNRFTKC